MYDGHPKSPLILSHPIGCARKYISYRNYGDEQAKFYCGRSAGKGEPGYMEEPMRVSALRSGLIMVSDKKQNCIHLFNVETNEGNVGASFLRKIGADGGDPMVSPDAICEDHLGNIIVCEKKRISVYNTAGAKICDLLVEESTEWRSPRAVAFNRHRRLLAVAHTGVSNSDGFNVHDFISVYNTNPQS